MRYIRKQYTVGSPNPWNTALIIAVVAIILIIAARCAIGAATYPTLAFLASELNLSVGQQLPKGVVWNGRPMFFYIVSARQLPDGEYDVRIRAR